MKKIINKVIMIQIMGIFFEETNGNNNNKKFMKKMIK